MGKWILKDWVIVAGVGLMFIGVLKLQSQEEEIQSLSQQQQRTIQMLREVEQGVGQEIQKSYEELEKAIHKEQSLFTSTSIEMKPKGSSLVVEMAAVPKEVKKGEQLIARLTIGERVYEEVADENNKAVFEIALTDQVQPVFILKSEEGIRQEALESQYTGSIFKTKVIGEWDSSEVSKTMLTISFSSDLPFEESEIDKAELIVVDTGIKLEDNRGYASSSSSSSSNGQEVLYPDHDIEGTALLLQKATQTGKDGLCYSIDLQKYTEQEDGSLYNFYFSIRTKSGMKYITPYNYIASLSASSGGISMANGEELLLPIMKQ